MLLSTSANFQFLLFSSFCFHHSKIHLSFFSQVSPILSMGMFPFCNATCGYHKVLSTSILNKIVLCHSKSLQSTLFSLLSMQIKSLLCDGKLFLRSCILLGKSKNKIKQDVQFQILSHPFFISSTSYISLIIICTKRILNHHQYQTFLHTVIHMQNCSNSVFVFLFRFGLSEQNGFLKSWQSLNCPET